MLQGYGTDRQREGLGGQQIKESLPSVLADVPTLCISWLRTTTVLGVVLLCGAVSKQFGSSRRRIYPHNIRHAFSGDIEKFEILSESSAPPVDMWTTVTTCMVSYCTDFVCQDSTTDYKPGLLATLEKRSPKTCKAQQR